MTREEFNELFNRLKDQYNTPIQIIGEFWDLVNLVQTRGYQRILEIGVERGGTIAFWDKIVGSTGRVVGADVQIQGRIPFDLNPQSDLLLIEGDSHALETIEQVKDAIPEVDFLFIDGDHRYEGAKADFENFSSLVRPGGLVAFHDIHDPGVGDLWRELESSRNTTKFHQPKPLPGIGIGVVYF